MVNRLILFFIAAQLFGCSYSFQNTKNPLADKEGVRKIYVSPVVNDSYKAGVENVVYNQLVRALRSRGKITLVYQKADADAFLETKVMAATSTGGAASQASALQPTDLGPGLPIPGVGVFIQYTATLTCSFELNRNGVVPGKKPRIWGAVFSRNNPYPGSNQLDVPGTTSALINDSEFDRSLSDLAKAMMDDVHESMLAIF